MEWINFLLVFTRVVSFFVTLPFTSYRGIPNLLKVFCGLLVAYLIFISGGFPYAPEEAFIGLKSVLLIGGEVFTGLTLGFTVLLVFSLFRTAGQFIDVKIGLSLAGIFDPQFGGTVSLISQFYYLLAILIYFAVNGHHYLFLALAGSFKVIPLGGAPFNEVTLSMLLNLFYYTWTMSFQIAAPILATVVITDISLGLISKTVPQIHVFLVGLPLKIFLGLLVIYMTLPYLSLVSEDVFSKLYTELLNILGSMT